MVVIAESRAAAAEMASLLFERIDSQSIAGFIVAIIRPKSIDAVVISAGD